MRTAASTEPGASGSSTVSARKRNEPIIKKHRSSGFVGTNLDLVLRSNRIETTVVIGVMTEGCVESTARDAAFYDYYVVLTPDCMASDVLAWHEASLTTMGGRHDIVPGGRSSSSGRPQRARSCPPPAVPGVEPGQRWLAQDADSPGGGEGVRAGGGGTSG